MWKLEITYDNGDYYTEMFDDWVDVNIFFQSINPDTIHTLSILYIDI